MRRREFVLALGGAAAAWPFAASSQQSAIPTIGFLSSRSLDESAAHVAALRQGLASAGAIEGQNVTIEYRFASGDYDRLPAFAAELAGRPVAVFVTVGGEPSVQAAKAASSTIPIVALFTADPVERGLVASLSRPGGNITGISGLNSALETKRLGLLRELLPKAAAFGALVNPTFPATAQQLKNMQEAARSIGVALHVENASNDAELEVAFGAMARQNVSGLVVAVDTFFVTRRSEIVALAARHALPAMYSLRDFTAGGGLMSYGVDLADLYRQAGAYAGRILKGAKPDDLPVVQPTKFEFVLNLKAARQLGLTPPPGLLSIADEVVE
jgi:putative ABC transport system substrate-binding protein